MRTLETEILNVHYYGTSRLGNPTYTLVLSDGSLLLTQTNGSVGYEAMNFRPRYDTAPTPVTLTLSKANRVTRIQSR